MQEGQPSPVLWASQKSSVLEACMDELVVKCRPKQLNELTSALGSWT